MRILVIKSYTCLRPHYEQHEECLNIKKEVREQTVEPDDPPSMKRKKFPYKETDQSEKL